MRESHEAAFFSAELGEVPTLDLHGMDRRGAQEAVEEFLNHAFMRREPVVKVIHGHGTETLKHFVETFLASYPIVEEWRRSTKAKECDAVVYVILSKPS